MFFVVVGTHTKCVINEFALDARIDILIFQCHTVTNGIDLRRSPPVTQLIGCMPGASYALRKTEILTFFFLESKS